MFHRSAALVGVALLAATSMEVGAASPSCFAACMADHKPKTDDYFAFAGDVKACRDECDAAALASLRDKGLYDAYAACKPEPLDKAEFRELRAANPSWQAQFNVFTWEVRNILSKRIITEIEVTTQDMNLLPVSFTAVTVIPPDETGTFVVTDFFDGYPAVRYATRVRGAKACTLP